MTVCIAAICGNVDGNGTRIVTVSDLKLSKGHYSTDIGAVKLVPLSSKWKVMIAGTFGQHHAITDAMDKELRECPDCNAAEIADIGVRAYQAYAKRLAEESVLSPYGMKLEEFISKRAELGDNIFQTVWADIGRTQPSCDLLVFGFDRNDVPHIFSLSNPTAENPSFVTHYDDPGFGAIGSGGYIAESVLYAHGQNFTVSEEDTIWHCCSAKFAAEGATDVGDATFLRVYGRNGNVGYRPMLPSELKQVWEENRPTIPQKALGAITGARH